MEDLIKKIIEEIGEDPSREGLVKTPHRVSESFKFLTKGYQEDVQSIINGAVFQSENDEMVIVKEIELYSLCEHHMLPFFGKAHVGYLPKNKIIGLSKIPRIVDVFARRLQIQERLTQEIAKCLEKELDPLGVMVVLEARHLCGMMRGVEKQNSSMVTSSCLGAFRDNSTTRKEFLSLLNL